MGNNCHWCAPYENGDLDMSDFVNPQNPDMSLLVGISPYEAQLVFELTLPGEEKTGQMRQKINFCPMCGRRLVG